MEAFGEISREWITPHKKLFGQVIQEVCEQWPDIIGIRRRKVVKEQPSSPAWIPVSERLPEVGKRVIWGYWQNGIWKEQMMDIESPIPKAIGWTHWHEVVILPPPPQPKTQQEKDEDAFKRWWEDTKDDPYAGCISESQKQSWHAALAYARGKKGEG